VNDPELLRQRRVAEAAPDDPKPLYRYRVLAIKAGADVVPCAGDHVQLLDEQADEDALVIRVRELAAGPQEVSVRQGDKVLTLGSDALRIVSPHRPAVLLGVDELARRLAEDRRDPHGARALETLTEVARRNLKEGIPCAIDLFAHVGEGPDEALRKALTQVCRSRPFGEIEVELRHRKPNPEDRDLLELPLLAAAATDESTARDVLDRLETMGDDAAEAAVRCGRNLVGAGGPAFVDADLRARVATLSREHGDSGLRVALFLHAVTVLQTEEVLVEKALRSSRASVRARACEELIRRKRMEPMWEHVAQEEDTLVLGAVLAAIPAPAPLSFVARALKAGLQDPALEQAALLRLPEGDHSGEGVELLAPWLKKTRKTNLDAALWCAGMLGDQSAVPGLLKRLGKLAELERIGIATEALIRLGHESGAPALDAWGVELLESGAWGEELVDTCGVMLGRRVDSRELLGRYVVAPPVHRARRSRALEAAQALVARGEIEAARPARAFLPCGLRRFADLEASLTQ
jgi:hypothetical protein